MFDERGLIHTRSGPHLSSCASLATRFEHVFGHLHTGGTTLYPDLKPSPGESQTRVSPDTSFTTEKYFRPSQSCPA